MFNLKSIVAGGGCLLLLLFSNVTLSWGHMSGTVDVLHVNTYGNYSINHLNGGFCFKLEGYDHYLKLKYHEEGERRANFDFTQSIVLAAYVSKQQLRVSYVDWGEDPTCRVRGAPQPAKWLEDVSFIQ